MKCTTASKRNILHRGTSFNCSSWLSVYNFESSSCLWAVILRKRYFRIVSFVMKERSRKAFVANQNADL